MCKLLLSHPRINGSRTNRIYALTMLALIVAGSCDWRQCARAADDKKKPATSAVEATSPKLDKDGWTPLFNVNGKKKLEGWKSTNFGGEGEVYLEKGNVVITQGVDLSGITSLRKDLPSSNYEIEFEAQRAAGSDFFVGLTFPVKKSSCSLIMGGWGGGVCGLSSLDGMDASENETTSYMAFTNGQWYKIRLKVTDERIEAWLDKVQLVEVETEGRKIDVRFEVEISKPLGFATYQSTTWIRNARIRQLPKAKSSAETTD
ncbi:MAG: DUF1080 domain-containing protein [Fuerstiella sp.]|nr:DUF1080 domain-containing protein [Fuerstiella sp.]MCP4854423.1 DUF1080 domain-containing protein [Fuerstiella sp.]